MIKVKAIMLIDFVRIIRTNPDKDWNRYLKAEDWEIVNSRLFNSNMYSYDSYRRIAFAVFKLVANSNLDTARGFGAFNMKGVLAVYKDSILVKGDPAASIGRLALLTRIFIHGGGDARVNGSGRDWLQFQIVKPDGETNEEMLTAFAHHIAGQLEELVRQAGGRFPVTTAIRNAAGYEIKVNWVMPALVADDQRAQSEAASASHT
ncbi:MAG TPA: hypothetical protein VM658_00905 [bacterium]|nr:hypothetical protein [bacterium]